jgi:hypothetical protein
LIDLADEEVVALARATEHLPPLRGGKPVHPQTVRSWAKAGVMADDGAIVRPETIRVGKALCTSVEAMQRFCDRLSALGGPPGRRPAARVGRAAAAARKCERLGL